MFSVETEEIWFQIHQKDDVWSSVIISAPDHTVTWGERGRGLNFSSTKTFLFSFKTIIFNKFKEKKSRENVQSTAACGWMKEI